MRAVIVHGTGGTPGGNWFPWLARELELRGIEVTVPQFPTWEGQSLDAWLERFVQELGSYDGADLLIGHSTGAAFLSHILVRRTVPALAAFYVAGYLREIGVPEYDAVNQTFFADQIDFARVRKNARAIVVYAGDDDPYVPYVQQQELATKLNAPLRTIPGGGHLNSEMGMTTFELLRDEIASVLSGERK